MDCYVKANIICKEKQIKTNPRSNYFGDATALNDIGLMIESGYGEVLPQIEKAQQYFREAHYLGNSDATINLALSLLNLSSELSQH